MKRASSRARGISTLWYALNVSLPGAGPPAAPVAATSPEPPRRVISKPEVVGTCSRLSDITEGIMRDDLVVMARREGRVVGM